MKALPPEIAVNLPFDVVAKSAEFELVNIDTDASSVHPSQLSELSRNGKAEYLIVTREVGGVGYGDVDRTLAGMYHVAALVGDAELEMVSVTVCLKIAS